MGGCCVIVGIDVDLGTGRRGANSVVGDKVSPRSRLSNARNAANHLISSSSLGAQRTNVRFAVMSRNVCSFSPRSLSFVFEGVDDCPSSFLRTRRDAKRAGGEEFIIGDEGGASESDSDGEEEG